MTKQKILPGLAREKGVIHLALPLLLLLLIGVVAFSLIYFGIVKNPFSNLSFFGQKEVKISTKTEYKNPFSKTTQYVNPFDTYKNPFAIAK